MFESGIISEADAWKYMVWFSAKLARDGFMSVPSASVKSALSARFNNATGVEGFDFVRPRTTGKGGVDIVGCAVLCKGGKADFYVVHMARDTSDKLIEKPQVLPSDKLADFFGSQDTIGFCNGLRGD